jgi:hypothetical protein
MQTKPPGSISMRTRNSKPMQQAGRPCATGQAALPPSETPSTRPELPRVTLDTPATHPNQARSVLARGYLLLPLSWCQYASYHLFAPLLHVSCKPKVAPQAHKFNDTVQPLRNCTLHLSTPPHKTALQGRASVRGSVPSLLP